MKETTNQKNTNAEAVDASAFVDKISDIISNTSLYQFNIEDYDNEMYKYIAHIDGYHINLGDIMIAKDFSVTFVNKDKEKTYSINKLRNAIINRYSKIQYHTAYVKKVKLLLK